MKRLLLSFSLCIFCSLNAFSQYSYEVVDVVQQLSNDEVKVYVAAKDTLVIQRVSNSELNICGHKYETTEEDVVVSPRVYYNSKLKTFILLLDKKVDYSIGCDVVSVNKGRYQYIGELSVAAYTKGEDGRMNYNSISPFVFLFALRFFQRFLFGSWPFYLANNSYFFIFFFVFCWRPKRVKTHILLFLRFDRF